MSVILECVGVPGSGKSTVVRELHTLVGEASHGDLPATPNISLGRRFSRKVMTTIRYPALLAIVVAAMVVDGRPVSMRLRALRWFLATLEAYDGGRIHAERYARPVLLDEGTIQRSLLLFYDESGHVKEKLLERYLRLAPMADIVVRLDVPMAIAAARNLARSFDPTDSRPDTRFTRRSEPLESVLDRADRFLAQVLAHISASRDVRAINLDIGDGSVVEALRAEVLPLLADIWDEDLGNYA